MKKRRLFALITLAVPIMGLLLLEASLHTFGYAGDLRLVIDREIMGRRFLSINRLVGRRYFTGEDSRIPEPPDDFFLPAKPADGIRIFCVGESTMAGFPYEYNATAPSMLKAALETRFPDRQVEVINVGMAAIGSAVVKDLMRDLTEFDPDLFIVYVGHNEFYGIFGAASSQGSTILPWLTDLYIATLRFKTVLLLRDALELATGTGGTERSLMEGLSQRASVHYEGEIYARCSETFARNLTGMIEIAQDAGVPLLFSHPVSNLSGIPPFLSIRSPLSNDREAHLESLMGSAREHLEHGQITEAIRSYQQAVSIDSGRAESWYRLGTAFDEAGRSDEALHAYTTARDLDGLRFRMSGGFGRELLRVAEDHGIPVARIDSLFALESREGIIGNTLMLEHVHPNIRGYALVAQSWVNAISRHGLLPAGVGGSPLAEELPSLSGVTAFDSTMGRIRISYLSHQWPFAEAGGSYQFKPDSWVEELSLRFVNKDIPWQAVRYQMSDRYMRNGQYEQARNEAFAVSRVLYFSYEPLLRIADYFLMEGKKDAALTGYQDCASTEDNPFAYHQIGRLHLERGEFTDAVAAFGNSIRSHSESRYQLPDRALALTHYLLGYSFVQTSKIEDGKDALRRAVRLDPGLAEARTLLEDLGG